MEDLLKELDDLRLQFLKTAETTSTRHNYSRAVEHYNVAIGLMLAITKIEKYAEKKVTA